MAVTLLGATCVLLAVAVVVLAVMLAGQRRFSGAEQRVLADLDALGSGQAELARVMREEAGQSRREAASAGAELRMELAETLARSDRALQVALSEIRVDNERRLDQMRAVVEEKLQDTLERRLGESFRQVGERLERVHEGLGEMHALAAGVGDLKRVLTNVKTRGGWGEVQLGALLEQILAPQQYGANVATNPLSAERVEFAIRLPGNGSSDGIWLPVDAKFPLEDYQRLLEAGERCDQGQAEAAARALDLRIRACARDIRDKYLHPPFTTDFGIMFLPSEGLYAEVLRRPGLADSVQREARVVIAGPTTLAALLSSLQIGFRTLAIEERSGQVWELLGAVRTQFGQFGDLLGKVQKKLNQASASIDDAARKSRGIERRLRQVEQTPAGVAPGRQVTALGGEAWRMPLEAEEKEAVGVQAVGDPEGTEGLQRSSRFRAEAEDPSGPDCA